MKVIAITGGIASGKSTVAAYLKSMGYQIIDSDKIVHQILTDPQIITTIKDRFGQRVLKGNQIDRSLLGKMIFSDQQSKLDLNAIIHPQVNLEIKRQLSMLDEEIVFVDVPLLYEAKMEVMMDAVIVVYVDYKTQLDRLMERDHIDAKYAHQKILAQMPLDEKRKLANFVIDNSEPSIMKRQVEQILRRIKDEI